MQMCLQHYESSFKFFHLVKNFHSSTSNTHNIHCKKKYFKSKEPESGIDQSIQLIDHEYILVISHRLTVTIENLEELSQLLDLALKTMDFRAQCYPREKASF